MVLDGERAPSAIDIVRAMLAVDLLVARVKAQLRSSNNKGGT
jgi:hypothetical protein